MRARTEPRSSRDTRSTQRESVLHTGDTRRPSGRLASSRTTGGGCSAWRGVKLPGHESRMRRYRRRRPDDGAHRLGRGLRLRRRSARAASGDAPRPTLIREVLERLERAEAGEPVVLVEAEPLGRGEVLTASTFFAAALPRDGRMRQNTRMGASSSTGPPTLPLWPPSSLPLSSPLPPPPAAPSSSSSSSFRSDARALR